MLLTIKLISLHALQENLLFSSTAALMIQNQTKNIH